MDSFNTSQDYLNNSTIESIKTAGLILNFIVVLPENIYVIWLIVKGAGNGVASEFFCLNLSVCEILLCLQCFLSLLCSTFPSLLLVVSFLYGIPITGRPLFHCLICVERYLAVIHPVTFLKYKPLRYRVICSTVAWIIIVISCLLNTLHFIQMHVFMSYCLFQALLTLFVQMFCCLSVLRALKQLAPGERKKDENHMKRRAFNTILLIMMSVLFVYATYMVAAFIYVLTHEFVAVIWTAGQACFILGGLVQPLLYLHRTGKLSFCKAS